ncbi:hypothetical protein DQ384_05725 [Sphaerisporangium album]|uniref:Uncharacterized protein n=1 Tax=Sphaerisporangium album TaxID=509200 RepID=A0A367FP69_9ACTN|nr:hypothetical protein DQ384_05725 [Sphaerisporangium album]
MWRLAGSWWPGCAQAARSSSPPGGSPATTPTLAPHMVNGKYYGRGDKTKIVLSDAEVVRLHERRRATEPDALELLRHEFESDPIPADLRQGHAHMFLPGRAGASKPRGVPDAAWRSMRAATRRITRVSRGSAIYLPTLIERRSSEVTRGPADGERNAASQYSRTAQGQLWSSVVLRRSGRRSKAVLMRKWSW